MTVGCVPSLDGLQAGAQASETQDPLGRLNAMYGLGLATKPRRERDPPNAFFRANRRKSLARKHLQPSKKVEKVLAKAHRICILGASQTRNTR